MKTQRLYARAAEVRTLTAKYESSSSRSEPTLTLIEGAPGKGKTHFARTCLDQLSQSDSPPLILSGAAASSNDVLHAYQVIGSALESPASNPNRNTERLEWFLKTLEEHAPDLLGIVIPGASILVAMASLGIRKSPLVDLIKRGEGAGTDVAPSQIRAQVHALLRALTAESPVILWVDDAQWADASSLATVNSILREGDLGVNVIVAARSDEILDRSATLLPYQKERPELLRLFPDCLIDLDDQDDTRYCREYLQDRFGDDPPSTWIQGLKNLTGGNPYFIDLVFKSLVDDGFINQKTDLSDADVSSVFDAVGDDVDKLISGFVGRLSEPAQRILRAGAVYGPRFPVEHLAPALNIETSEAMRIASEELARQPDLIEYEDIGDDLTWYKFDHHLLHRALEGMTDLGYQRSMSRHFARISSARIDGLRGSFRPQLATSCARHLKQAGDTEGAARVHIRLANHFLTHGLVEDAAEVCEQGTSLNAGSAMNLAFETFKLAIAAETSKSARSEAEAGLQKVAAEASKLGADQVSAGALALLGSSLWKSGRLAEAEDSIRKALDGLGKDESDIVVAERKAKALCDLGVILRRQRRYLESSDSYSSAEQVCQRHDLDRLRAMVLNNRGVLVGVWQGDNNKAVRFYSEARVLAAQTGAVNGEALYSRNLALARSRLGDFETSLELASRAIDLSNRIHDSGGVARGHSARAQIHLRRGEFEAVVKDAKVALDTQDASAAMPDHYAFNLVKSSFAYLRLGQVDIARTTLDELPLIDAEEFGAELLDASICEALIETHMEAPRVAELWEACFQRRQSLANTYGRGIDLYVTAFCRMSADILSGQTGTLTPSCLALIERAKATGHSPDYLHHLVLALPESCHAKDRFLEILSLDIISYP